MNNTIKILLDLQEHDKKIDSYKAELERIPQEIALLEQKIAQLKEEAQASKADLTKAQLVRKEKELEIDTLEATVAKHNKELGAIKTNEAYKALSGEIEKAKTQKNAMEENVLELMETIETLTKQQKSHEATLKQEEAMVQTKISEWKSQIERVKAELAAQEKTRQEFTASVPKEALSKYEFIRTHKKGLVVVPLQGASCGGCRMSLPPQVLNEIKKSNAEGFVQCERCQRILFLIEVPESAK